jgi:hypothetical protein
MFSLEARLLALSLHSSFDLPDELHCQIDCFIERLHRS